LAEESAANGEPSQDLDSAVTRVNCVAGAALMVGTHTESGRTGPENTYSGTIASFVAKIAEKAAEAARTTGDDSLYAAEEAFSYISDLLDEDNHTSIAKNIAEDIEKIYQLSKRSEWSDTTRIPVNIWAIL
jgi:hypothetical protein